MRVNIKNIKKKTLKYFEENCRALEVELLKYFYAKGSAEKVVAELSKFQNIDGGFGNALESDFRMPESSPLATTIALQIIERLGADFTNDEMLEKILNYLEETYNSDKQRWFAASKEINVYPRAIWWNFDEKTGGVSIDKNWGNPTVEITGYIFKYRKFIKKLDIELLINRVIEYINNKELEEAEEHEIYCFLRFYELINEENKKRIEEKLKELVKAKMSISSREWNTYVPQPINFIKSKNSFLYEEYKDVLYENLNFLMTHMQYEQVWEPTWEWHQFNKEWEIAEQDWIGVLTIEYLQILDNFGLILK